MGEAVKITDCDDSEDRDGDGEQDQNRVMEWEVGLPTVDDLTPLTQQLIPAELASAFSITPEPCRSMFDVNRASHSTLAGLLGGMTHVLSTSSNLNIKSFNEERSGRDSIVVVEEDGDNTDLPLDVGSGSDSRKVRGVSEVEEDAENFIDDSSSARAQKRPRLVWTPQLHKRFVDVVAHLGIKNAVPKTIMQMMNVEGLTRENVASHLQKYRLYLKRMQGFSNVGPSPSDHKLFASTPTPASVPTPTPAPATQTQSSGSRMSCHVPMQIPMPYPPQMLPMPMFGMAHGHMGMAINGSNNAGGAPATYQGFDLHNPFSNMVPQGHRVTSKDK